MLTKEERDELLSDIAEENMSESDKAKRMTTTIKQTSSVVGYADNAIGC